MNESNTQPVCVVVGVGPGNGAAFARRFHAEGYAVALLARRSEYAKTLTHDFDGMRAYACDVTDGAAVASTFERIRRELGDVSALLYNAGSGTWGTFEEVSDDAFETAWQVNCLGLLRCVREVVGPMRNAGSGAIIVSGATASLRGRPFTAAFAQAKAAQRSLAQSLARQLGPEGIHVSLLIIDGQIAIPGRPIGDRQPDEFLDPDDIATAAYSMATQPRSAWTFELDLRPYRENW